MLEIASSKDAMKLAESAKAGKVSWRETLLGGCTKQGPCAYGGVDNLARCGGGDGKAPCADILLDREKAPTIRRLERIIANRLVEAPIGSPLQESLVAQQRAVENALNVLGKQ